MPSLLPTKLYLPPLPADYVARPQLLEYLGEALTHRLTLVSAPAGAGKSTLLSAWVQLAREKEAAFGWLSLDEDDNDLGRFLAYLIECLEDTGTVIDTPAVPLIQDEKMRAENVVEDIIRGMLDLKREVILIFDDYHLIANRDIHQALEYLIGYAPPQLHLVLLTRSDPPLELARLRVTGELAEVRMQQLRFSPQETACFLEKTVGVQLSESDLSALYERTEGWIAGLQMAAISLRGREDISAFITAFTGSHRYVFDYLLEQVLNRQSPEVRDFLLKTSILDRLSASLCDAVMGTDGTARSRLDTLERTNLFLIPLDEERGWYRYHHLFTDLLHVILEQTHPGLTVSLHQRACRWYEAQLLLPEALHHALLSGDMQLVAQIVSANVLVLIENDEAISSLHKIDAITMDEITAFPWLGIARTWILGARQVEKSLRILDVIESGLVNIPDLVERQRLKGHIASARAYVFSNQGDKVNTVKYAGQAIELLPVDEVAVRAMNLTIWGDILSADRHDPSAMPILEKALALALQAQKPHVAMIAASALASAHLGAGRLHELHRVCIEALEIAEEYQRHYQRPLSASASVYPLLARVYGEWGENEKAIQCARKGLIMNERWGLVDNEITCLDYLGRALAFGNDWEGARRVFQRAYSEAQNISPWIWQMSNIFALDSLLDNEIPDDSEIAQQIRRVEESGAKYPPPLKARLLLRENKPDEALKVVEQALREYEGQPSFEKVRIYALSALAYQAKGDEKQALASLRQALKQAEPENRVASFVREGPAMEKLLRSARARSIAPSFTQRLLGIFESRRRQIPVAMPVIDTLIEPLSERELEVLQILDGPLSTPEIAEQLVVSANTVRTHIKNIYGKLGVHGRSGAVKRAKALGLLN